MVHPMGVFCVWGAGLLGLLGLLAVGGHAPLGLLAVGGNYPGGYGEVAGWCVAVGIYPSPNASCGAGMAPCGGVNP